MDQTKIGALLKELRTERGLTQEQLAEKLNTTNRTVSRWETGRNLPDLSLLIELADLYGVDIREIICGERKSEAMNSAEKDTLEQVAAYSDKEKAVLKSRMLGMTLGAAAFLLLHILLGFTDGFGLIPPEAQSNMQDFLLGLTMAALVLNAMYYGGRLDRLRQWKLNLFRRKGRV